KTYEEEVEDFLEVKIHLDEDDRGPCIYAIESHVPFTVDANFENVAKTWWFDLVESNPLVEASVLERFEDHIMYLKHEYSSYKYRRLCVAGVFLDRDQDRITITQTAIALDDRFPLVEVESRSNGFQWIVFQRITDRLTVVRWSISNFCPVNADGPISLREYAEKLRCNVNPKDSEEALCAKIQSGLEQALGNLRDQFRSRFKLEPTTMGSRDFAMESRAHGNDDQDA
ncbi:hypothetical protein AeRB84_007913, partial [Aphanomyces euteiches]